MNKNEKLAYKYLKEKYPESEVNFSSIRTYDFEVGEKNLTVKFYMILVKL